MVIFLVHSIDALWKCRLLEFLQSSKCSKEQASVYIFINGSDDDVIDCLQVINRTRHPTHWNSLVMSCYHYNSLLIELNILTEHFIVDFYLLL